ncbi:SDR family oxidoreductase [Paenibacillus sp. KQZ6P-2]|uniref:SDR family oxidoreductase n=1 Tax=Paenibacillus mangrovi TaxID=2931978 RepID=A0A9X1WK10_9BACL|nr:SDR family oxidoreductase [Paenibacillus mangrovi]MCJ8010418.1 SDR family oxidoreductase [Paenibacillus mangrovi]
MDYGLDGKVVMITGGSRGIGKATARKFAGEGAHVYITYSSNRNHADRTAEEIRQSGGSCSILQLSLNNRQSIDQAIEQIKNDHDRLDVLVNNAVFWGEGAPVAESSSETWFSVIDQTVKGTYLVTKLAVPLMKQSKWGRFIHVSSSLVHSGKPNESANVTSKAALHGFSRTLALELAADGIFSNVVIPELTLSEWVTDIFPPNVLEEYAQSFPPGRIGTPDDVANLIVYLGSAANSFVNGEEIRVTGGK